MNKLGKMILVVYAIGILALIGECRCIYKAVTCNWEPIGKAEIIYSGAAACGLGAIVGWLEIEDK